MQITKIKNKLHSMLNSISNSTKKTLSILSVLIGIRKKGNSYNLDRCISTSWIFISGIPIGFILMGSYFSICIWGLLILIISILCNIDYYIKGNKEKCQSTFTYSFT
jgi:hypothetical protein